MTELLSSDQAIAAQAAAFVARWQHVSGSELANAQSFFRELCELLGVPVPHTTPEQDYMFERPLTMAHREGDTTAGRVDCYKRGCFVWESKKLNPGAQAATTGKTTKGFDEKMLAAYAQAEGYARALPASEGRPPYLVVVDIGHIFELYADFTRSGAIYTPFPDARSNRIRLADLESADTRDKLRRLWTDPLSLDPARASARVTREVSAELAELAKSLEAAGHAPQTVAAFLSRCLFSMFVEDIGLLPTNDDGIGGFQGLLERYRYKPERLPGMLRLLWQGMDAGGPNGALEGDNTLRFNGKLFKGSHEDGYVLPLNTEQVESLLRAANAKWQEVEPSIFGTLLERALNPDERHALGAHYTPRAYVERLVMPTVIEPLRADWADAQAAALLLAREAETLGDAKKREAKLDEARAEIRRFHHQLCTVRVLDPACGSGNFLYVTLEHLKRLEGEVLNQLEALGETQARLGWAGETVTLQQLRGIELNPRAAALAELVLWIGWLQWHVRSLGLGSVAEPVVHDYGNIECRDAVLQWDAQELALDAGGKTVMRWDGKTFKTHPVTGEDVPDEAAQVPQWRYVNPRKAQWPQADFIVGNPPFIGAASMRAALGDGYAEALRSTWNAVPESADFVMYWWQHAAETVRAGDARRFGFITTNSLRQTFNRRVLEPHLADPKQPLHLAFAIPDHPWVDSAQGAAVRIAMTVGALGSAPGRLLNVTSERDTGHDEVEVSLSAGEGALHADLRLGANINAAAPLQSNQDLSNRGVQLFGAGFIVTPDEAAALGLGRTAGLEQHVRDYRNGRDLTDRPRGVKVIDLFGLSADQVRAQFPAVYQWLLERVKPERDQNNRATYRDNWWVFGEPRKMLRKQLAGLPRYVATVETAKHRAFQFVDASILPDNMLVAIASADALHLGVLSSRLHNEWALAMGGTLEDRPRYNKTRCFETFPFPAEDTGLTPALADTIRKLAEQIDAHRKARQAEHESVTLTGLYNVLDKLRRSEALNAKEKALHEQGLVSVLRTLHDELDASVLKAYGWSDLGPVPWTDEAARTVWTETLLERLVVLNARRAAEEAAGTVRWLRPDFQDPSRRAADGQAEPSATQDEIDLPEASTEGESGGEVTPAAAKPTARAPWPGTLPEQMRAVAEVLARAPRAPRALDVEAVAAHFTGKGPWKKRLPEILSTLEALGRATHTSEGWRGR